MDELAQPEEPWRACFEGAWDAFVAGTIPVGAAVVAPGGAVVARGRNRIFEVGKIEYSTADPFGGGCSGAIDTAHWRRSAPEIGEPVGGWPGRLSAALQSAFWQAHDHPRAAEIIDAFGADAQAAGRRVLLLADVPHGLQDALPRLLSRLDC